MKTENQKPKIVKLLLCLAGVVWLAGCSWFPPSALDQDYGNSVRNNLAQSVVNPRAALKDNPASGLSPNASATEMERYNKTFKGEEKKSLGLMISQ